MKKLLSLAILIATSLCIVSCQSDKDDVIGPDKPFKPVSVDLSTVMGTEENPQTKADQYPTDPYRLDYLYLMVNTGENVFEPFKINLVSDGDLKKFNLRISSITPEAIEITTNGVLLTTIQPKQEIYFSSHPTCEVSALVDDNYTTPNGGEVYAPFGRELYKSAHTAINLIENGFEIGGKEYLANQNNNFELLMYRLTGSFRAKVIFFMQDDPQDETPLSVTPEDWTAAGLAPFDQWTVTPYLRDYYQYFMICKGARGQVAGEPTATYLLSQGPKELITETLEVHKVNVGDFMLTTLVAGTSVDYFPYVFHGPLYYGSTISFYIKNETTGEGAVTTYAIADVYLGQEIMPNDFKTLNVCINIAELHQRASTKSGMLDSKNVFFFWE